MSTDGGRGENEYMARQEPSKRKVVIDHPSISPERRSPLRPQPENFRFVHTESPLSPRGTRMPASDAFNPRTGSQTLPRTFCLLFLPFSPSSREGFGSESEPPWVFSLCSALWLPDRLGGPRLLRRPWFANGDGRWRRVLFSLST